MWTCGCQLVWRSTVPTRERCDPSGSRNTSPCMKRKKKTTTSTSTSPSIIIIIIMKSSFDLWPSPNHLDQTQTCSSSESIIGFSPRLILPFLHLLAEKNQRTRWTASVLRTEVTLAGSVGVNIKMSNPAAASRFFFCDSFSWERQDSNQGRVWRWHVCVKGRCCKG